MPPVPDTNPTIEVASVLGTQGHPYHHIVSANQLKTADITEDYPDTDPIPTLPSNSVVIVIGCYWPPNVPSLKKLFGRY